MDVELPRTIYDALRTEVNAPPEYIEGLHPKQAEFVNCNSKLVAACCGRRAGKSRGLVAKFARKMEEIPGERSLYMTVTRGKAREVMWDNGFARLKAEFGYPVKRTTEENQLIIRHANGSSIWLLGVPDQGDIDKVRGGYYAMAAIDEAQAFPDWLKGLIEDALEPALMDLDGDLLLTGTPAPALAGFFYEVSTGIKPGWASFHFTALDNPYLAHTAPQWIERKRLELGEDSPTFQREIMGRWVNDPESLVYPFTWARNHFNLEGNTLFGLPDGEYRFGLGIDLGFGERSTSFTLAANSVDQSKLYLLRSYVRSRMTPQSLAAHVRGLKEEVRSVAGKGLLVVIDEGALGGGYAQQLRDWGIACEPAKKTEKRAYQEWMRGFILSGSILANFGQCRELIDESSKLPFDPDTGKEHESYRRHCCDGALYVARHMLPRYKPELEQPKPGTAEWLDAEAKKMREDKIREIQDRKAKRR